MTWPMRRPFGYGERTPPGSSIPAVTTSSPSSIVSVESMFVISKAPASWPTTWPEAPLVWSCPMTVEVWSVMRMTLA
jgi:hypothetical protein